MNHIKKMIVCCAHCGASDNKALGLNDASPNPGEYIICPQCDRISVLTEDYQYRKATDEEVTEFKGKLAELKQHLMKQNPIGYLLALAKAKADQQAGKSTPIMSSLDIVSEMHDFMTNKQSDRRDGGLAMPG